MRLRSPIICIGITFISWAIRWLAPSPSEFASRSRQSSVGGCNHAVSAAGFAVDEPTLSFFQSAADDDAALAEVFNTLTGHRHARSFLNYLVRKARAGTTKAAFLGYLDAWTTADFSAEAAKLDVPFLVVAGTHDEALGPQHQRETYLKHLSNVRMQVLEGAGHYPMLETPPELFTVVEAFLTENGPASLETSRLTEPPLITRAHGKKIAQCGS